MKKQELLRLITEVFHESENLVVPLEDGAPLTLFDEPLVVEEQWILIEKEIEIEPVENPGGGLSPGVDAWGDEWADIQL